MSNSSSEQSTKTSRERLFTVAALLLPVLFFALLEGGLRVFGYGDSYPLFVPVEVAPEYRFQNPQVARRYFAAQRRVPNANTDFFKAEKRENGIRIFVQGGSSAAGYPFYNGGAFSRLLEQRLQQTFADRDVEVVNTAMAAVNSYALADLSDEILAEQPDAVLIYAGHNEYYGALGVASAESLGRLQPVVSAYLKLRQFRTVQLLRNLIVRARTAVGGSARPDDATLMERIVGEQRVPLDSELFDLGVEQFRRNLEALLSAYQTAGVPVYIGTLASNERDHAPFLDGFSAEADSTAWRRVYDRARGLISRGDTLDALAALDRAIGIDSEPATAHFLRGRLLEVLGRADEAREAYVAAKDRDQLRFRAPERFNEVIREVADAHGATVVEVNRALASASPDVGIGRSMMVEHLHPTLDGYFRIADAFYDALNRTTAFGSWPSSVSEQQAYAERLHTVVDSLAGVYRVRKLMGGWPFKPAGSIDRTLDTLQARNLIEQIALDVYRNEVTWQQGTAALRRYYAETGRPQDALRAAFAMIQAYPFFAGSYLDAADILANQGRLPDALVYYQAANDLEITPKADRMIGAILLRNGDRSGARMHLERALDADPEDTTSLYNLAGLHAMESRPTEAREALNRLLVLEPNHPDARRLMASIEG